MEFALVSQELTPGRERFALDEPVLLRGAGDAPTGRIRELSLSGVAVRLDSEAASAPGDWLAVTISDAGEIPARAGPDGGYPPANLFSENSVLSTC